MTPRDFCYWLNGFFEMQEPTEISEKQTEMIKRHLALVMKNVTKGKEGIDFSKLIEDISKLPQSEEPIEEYALDEGTSFETGPATCTVQNPCRYQTFC